MAYHFPKQTQFYEGKVRDVYYIDNKYLVMIVSDRISAFDVVLPRPIPYKGQVLNQIAATFIKATEDIVPNWIINVPAPNISIGKMCEPFKVEMVIRGYLAGSAWRAYKSGIREICGVQLLEGLKENQKLETPIITPTTKASVGHDEEISKAEIIARNIVSNEDYEQLEKYTHQIFQRGTEIAEQQGLILVDTKYEFGKIGNEIYLIDEIHTPDSSRYFYADVYEENFKQNLPQKQLSKEFVREWLMENNFMGKVGQTVPNMTDEIVQMISDRYIELYETILGKKFIKQDNIDEEQIILQTLEQLDI
ncbi:MAG: phosphoribosylaminoimidazolesuccinocarboxamide synthase [Bacteroidetes bacterium]|nr:phosphoribosylaminoimidazolesuccinocarboxamide synthase [Bacteroidota bacterium]